MDRKMRLIGTLYFIFVFILAMFALVFLSKNINISENSKEEYTAIKRPVITVPTEEELEAVEQSYNKLITYFEDTGILKEEIKELCEQVEKAKVCSIANRRFNSLEEKYTELNNQISTIQEQIVKYQKGCEEYLSKIETIPKYSSVYDEKLEEFDKRIGPNNSIVSQEESKLLVDKGEILEYYLKSKQIADDFFEEYYVLMCKIVNAEAGGCSGIC